MFSMMHASCKSNLGADWVLITDVHQEKVTYIRNNPLFYVGIGSLESLGNLVDKSPVS